MLSLPVPVSPPVALPPVVPAGRWSSGRTVPNLPGALTRQLSARLWVDATAAMRIALLYGDIEWQAAGEGTVRYSARDYARRQGLHPHTVQADLRRLIAIGALEARYDVRHGATLSLCGLLEAAAHPPDPAGPSPAVLVDAGTQVASPPGRADHPALGHTVQQGWSMTSTTLENSSKRTAKKKTNKGTANEGKQSRTQAVPESPRAMPPSGELLAELLEAFRHHRPQSWPAAGTLTLTSSRRRKLQQALAFAGSPEALRQRLIAALAQVPPWYRQTYPQRPDGSRRPAHQFVDLLFRASAQERDCGPEAWHLFAWSESVSGVPQAAAAPHGSELERARSLFHWDGFLWRCQGVEALRLPPAERRRLTALLEGQGIGVPGSGAIQFAGEALPLPSLSDGNGAMGP